MKYLVKFFLSSFLFFIAFPVNVSAEVETTILYEAYQAKLDDVYDNELSRYIESNYPGNFSYSLYDIDGNGIEELILLEGGVKHIYTYDLNNNEVVFLKDASAPFTVRSYSYITHDGIIYNMSVGGASFSVYSAYEISDNGIDTHTLYEIAADYDKNAEKPYFKTDHPEQLFTENEFLQLVDGRYFDSERSHSVDLNTFPISYTLNNDASEIKSAPIDFNQDWYEVLQDIGVEFDRQDLNLYTMLYSGPDFDPIFDSWHKKVLTGTPLEAYRAFEETFSYAIRKINHSDSEKRALNHIRTLAFYNISEADDSLRAEKGLRTTKAAWLERYENKHLIRTDAVLNELMNRVMIATGLAVQARDIIELSQNGSIISVAFRGDELVASGFDVFDYDLQNDTISLHEMGGDAITLPLESHFEEAYGLYMDYTYEHQLTMPSDYQLELELAEAVIYP